MLILSDLLDNNDMLSAIIAICIIVVIVIGCTIFFSVKKFKADKSIKEELKKKKLQKGNVNLLSEQLQQKQINEQRQPERVVIEPVRDEIESATFANAPVKPVVTKLVQPEPVVNSSSDTKNATINSNKTPNNSKQVSTSGASKVPVGSAEAREGAGHTLPADRNANYSQEEIKKKSAITPSAVNVTRNPLRPINSVRKVDRSFN